ncbi:tRNA 2-selenouridine(34) synthase MnmH [Sediminibacterium sp.]|uniref:tRNA 2-selenouridine(34) synthase MnmH n=1 Tax=Sediminibacterium sp. TaxID=1917865 RepID=UPI0027347A2E|nr:tRNA 2-selenouridine(34) synthase MnmH [Sediminibacterium sp.]MDP3394448.1 tRNA 2-selenouridine(34) synthase MnmH [Sediminibacterium sp.]MDP3568283.1 tRNA 2-selenouridine(34) synthase MnmH [Sediminibacterium sp.]
MAVSKLLIDDFIQLSKQYPVFDVRSEGEYLHAHIPGAHSLPLFNNEERKVVGTAYKQESKQKAIKIGLKYFGVKMVKMVDAVEKLTEHTTTKTVLVHCWRGGMRSAGVAWLLDLYGFKVYTLVGGYKTYRNWVLKQFDLTYPIQIIGGYTGSGKTEVLQELGTRGEQIIDLEGLAHHKGSAFGALGQPPQPSQEMFENILAAELSTKAPLLETGKVIWLEDESQRIGEVNIPTIFFKQMRANNVLFLDIPFDERLQYILQGYGKFGKEHLVNAVIRIKKRLGGLETKTAINCLIEDDIMGCFAILLKYYDKGYYAGSQKRENPEQLIQKIPCDRVDAKTNAIKLLQ